jgi:hypothetical protein
MSIASQSAAKLPSHLEANSLIDLQTTGKKITQEDKLLKRNQQLEEGLHSAL